MSEIQAILPDIINIRHTIHANPELCYEEVQTAALVAQELAKYGYTDIKTGVGRTGVVAVLDSGKPGKTVALRADMDALPILEQTGVAYASKNPGKMHACGHDGHTATLLGVARLLQTKRNQFSGKIKFIFQPAEEGGAGAAAMIKDGVLENPKVDAVFGYHNWTTSEVVGAVSVKQDCLMAGVDTLRITIQGHGGHAAVPEKTVDPIFVASHVIQALQGIASRLTAATEPLVLSITQIHAGTTHNIIPDEVFLEGTIRTTSLTTRREVKLHIEKIVQNITAAFGATAVVNVQEVYPPLMNTAAETEFVFATAQKLFGTDKAVVMPVPIMGAEDFSFYVEKIPGCFFFVSNGVGRPIVHNSHYDFNDEVLPFAIKMLEQLALDYLNKN